MGVKVTQESRVAKKGDNEANDGPLRPKGIVQTRYIFTVMMFLGMAIGIANNLAMSIVIVGMIDQCKRWKYPCSIFMAWRYTVLRPYVML